MGQMFGTALRDFAAPVMARRHRARRGRSTLYAVLLTVLAMIVLAGVAYCGGSPAQRAVVVRPGQTLWGIAAAAYPGDDVQTRVDGIESANHLAGGLIMPGERLILPAP
jgi:nucleoid-associated protein YgaU